VNSEKDVCCIASTQTNAERLMNTAPTLSRDKDRTIVGYNSFCLAGNFVDRNTNQNGSGAARFLPSHLENPVAARIPSATGGARSIPAGAAHPAE